MKSCEGYLRRGTRGLLLMSMTLLVLFELIDKGEVEVLFIRRRRMGEVFEGFIEALHEERPMRSSQAFPLQRLLNEWTLGV